MSSRLLKLFKSTNFAPSAKHYWTASVSSANRAVLLKQADSGEQLSFPAVWLRDNCLCPSCFNEAVKLRLNSDFRQTSNGMLPESIQCSKNESDELLLEVTWPDNHESKFPLQWLRTHSFEENRQKSWLRNNYFFGRQTWNSETFSKCIRYFRFKEILESDEVLLRWLIALNRYGLTIIKDAGTDISCVEQLANRVGFLKHTTYGKNFIVAAKENATHVAYMPTSLQLHTDLAYYEYQPSYNFLHFVQQSPEITGGVNQLVDGFEVSQQLKEEDPWMYKVLTQIPVEWTRSGKEENKELHHINRAPVICENVTGEVQRVNFGPTRGSQFCVSIEQANDWYKAMNYFVDLMHHPRNVVELKMEQGNMLTFVNVRIVHGRSAFTAGARTLIGGYMDWDVVNSKTRGLLREFKIEDVNDLD